MSEALKEKGSELYQSKTKDFILFSQDNPKIQIVFKLPGTLLATKDNPEYYPRLDDETTVAAPTLINRSGFEISEATFSVTLQDLISSDNVIANVYWFSLEDNPIKTLNFKCKNVKNNESIQCSVAEEQNSGYTRVRWATMANNGNGTTALSCNVSPVKLTFTPSSADQNKSVNGPTFRVG